MVCTKYSSNPPSRLPIHSLLSDFLRITIHCGNRLPISSTALWKPTNEMQSTRKDLSVLNLFVLRTPRKLIAHAHCCSVVAIEKRLAKIKNILAPQSTVSQDYSLSDCLLQVAFPFTRVKQYDIINAN